MPSDKEELYGRLFRTITKHFPEIAMGDRTDCVMDLYQDVVFWSTGEYDEEGGIHADVVSMDIDVMEILDRPRVHPVDTVFD